MTLAELRPVLPEWARDTEIPEPEEDELFADYVRRLGYNESGLLADLTDQTASLANLRLATRLAESMPDAFDRYVALLRRRFRVVRNRG